METLKQLITDAEKHKRIRTTIEQYLQSKAFTNYVELAGKLDMYSNTLYEVMSGKRKPADILIYKFCEYYKLNPGFFFGREPKPSNAMSRTVRKEDLLSLQKINSEMAKQINDLILK